MEEIRKNHNDAKRDLIQTVSQKGWRILDVGCGFGGFFRNGTSVG